MLDRNFTELDNDFITLWSQILLRKDFKYGETITPKGFIQLVELGQMDAMQYYPWFYNYDSRILSDDAHTNGLLPIGGSDLNLLKLNMMRRQRHNHHKFNARPPHSLLTLLAQEINTLMGLMYDYASCANLIALERYYEIKAQHRIFRSCKICIVCLESWRIKLSGAFMQTICVSMGVSTHTPSAHATPMLPSAAK